MAPEGSPEAETDDSDPEFVEVDPIGRYGRYKEVLGKGAFKKVYRAFDELEGIEVAWNQVKVSELLRNSEDLERLYSEVHLLKTLKHKNIIKFYNSWIDTKNEHINFITEIFTSGTLRQYRKKHKHVDLRALKKWSRQILEGLHYLHSHNPPVIHRDLKCDNIFVNGNHGEVKIGDLGLAAILHHANAAHSVIGTPEFMAPELYEEEYNELVDIYAFGMCLLELVTFEYPYTECSNAAQIYRKVTTGIKPASLAKVTDPTVKAFVEKCIAHLPERLSAKELLGDPFLSDVILENKGDSLHIKLEHKEVNADQSNVGRIHFEDCLPGPSRNHLEDSRPKPEECQPGPTRDLSVQGERKDVNTIFIKLKIVDSTGVSHNIHFPFDVEADTSIAVASEMVHELETDQDIPTIADMIDSEIRALIPEWSPRDSSTGESAFDSHISDSKDEASPIPLSDNKDDVSPMTNISPFSGSSLFPDQLPSGRKFWSDSPRAGGGLSPIKSNSMSPSDVCVTTPRGQTCQNVLPSKPGSSNLNEESHEEITNVLATPRNNLVETFDGLVLDQRSKDECDEIEKTSADSSIESMEVSTIVKKLDQLLHVQQKELDELKRKHDLVVSDFFKELSPQIRMKVFNMCRGKTLDYKLHTTMDFCSQCATPTDSCELSSDNGGSGVSAKRIFTRSISTIDLTICPRISSDSSIKSGTPRVGGERPSGSLKGFKKESITDGIAVILTEDAKESQSWTNTDD